MDFQNLRTLITGGAGFIGSHLARKLVSLGAEVTIYDNFSTGKFENVSDIHDKIKIIEGDILDYYLLKSAIKDQSIIFHMAANASVPNSFKNPTYDFETNAIGTYNVLRASRELNGNIKIIYVSSAAIYGEAQVIPIPETLPPNPVSPYGVSKLVGEMYCKLFFKTYGIPIISLRYFNVYGPHQPRYVMHDFLEKLSRDQSRLEVLGTGEQVRDFIYVSDAVNATLFLASKDGIAGEKINIGSGKGIKIKTLAELTVRLLKLKNVKKTYTGETWPGDVNTLLADVRKLNRLGFTHTINLEDGYKLFIRHYLKEKGLKIF